MCFTVDYKLSPISAKAKAEVDVPFTYIFFNL